VRLYHVSDRPGIRRFEPRPPADTAEGGGIIWAIDGEHLHNYLLPRDCPRVTFYALPESDPEDVGRLMCPGGARFVVAVESRWLARIRDTTLYLYEVDARDFSVQDAGAGYRVSRRATVPLAETRIDDILGALAERDVELRVMPSLWGLREVVIHSSLQFSIIRMRNAHPPPEGAGAYHPLPPSR
jgi:hypothetical protein